MKRYEHDETVTRFAYVALWRASTENDGWRNCTPYTLDTLIDRQHVDVSGELVCLNEAGLRYWAEEIKRTWSPNQKMKHDLTRMLERYGDYTTA